MHTRRANGTACGGMAATAMATRRRRSAARSGLTRRPAAPCHGPASDATPLPRAWLLLLLLPLLLLLHVACRKAI